MAASTISKTRLNCSEADKQVTLSYLCIYRSTITTLVPNLNFEVAKCIEKCVVWLVLSERPSL